MKDEPYWRERRPRRSSFVEGRRAHWLCDLARGLRYWQDALAKNRWVWYWESYARRLVDSPNVQLCLTGSSSKLLSEEIATQMRGRSIPIEVFPLSFPEYLRFNGVFKKIPRAGFTAREKGVLRRAMSEYMERGGFPDAQGCIDLKSERRQRQ